MAMKTSPFHPQFVDSLIKDCKKPEDILGKDGLLKQLTKAILERMMETELTDHLGYEKYDPSGQNSGNSRNGTAGKTLKCEEGEIELRIPRDRNGEFSPAIVGKHQTHFSGFDEKIMSLYGRGMTTRDIKAQLSDLYGVDVSPSLISQVTNAVMNEVKIWQSRPLDKLYPVVYLDALMIKIREDKRVINKAFYLALGITCDGQKELLGIWMSQHEGAKFWLNILTELKNRGVEDILIACVDGLTGFPDAIATVFPATQVQLCIVHMVRHSLRYVSYKNRKAVASDLKAIYGADTLEGAELALATLSDKWDKLYPNISKSWLNHWENIIPFFSYPKEIRKIIYTTNAIESLNMSIRKIIKNKRIFPSDDAALKQLYLALENISKKWTMPLRDWSTAMNQFIIMFGERVEGKI